MTIGTTITNAQGVVSTLNTTGLSVQQDTANAGFSPFIFAGSTTVVSTSAAGNSPQITIGQAGLILLSGSGAVLTPILPPASSSAGVEFVFRSLDARAHVITSSLETAGSKVINGVHPIGTMSGSQVWGQAHGAKATFDGAIGTSCALYSDGLSWIVAPGSGSVTVS
jgi:hypothetical protein